MWKNIWSAESSRARSAGSSDSLMSVICRVSAPTPRSSASATRCLRCRSRWPARCSRRSTSPVTWGDDRLDSRRDGGGAQRGDGLQPPGRRADGRAQPAHREARDPARRDERARSGGVRRRLVGRVRVRVVAAESALLRAVAGGARDRVLVFARQALHDLDAAVSRPGDGGRAGRRLAGGRRPRRLGAVAAGARRSAPGSAASTCSMPARISTSIARTACNSIPVRFGVRDLAGDLARDARRRGRRACSALAFGRAARRRLSRRRRRGRGDARLRAVAGARRRSVAGQARVRSERLRRHPLSAGARRSRSMVRWQH